MSSAHASAINEAELDPNRWKAMIFLLLAGFMNLVDVTIVNVGLPSLQKNLGATSSEMEWVVAGYVLSFALFLLPFGRLGDIVGRKTFFLAGVVGFTFFSVLCGLAPNMTFLIIARLLQGMSSAAMMPQVLAIAQVAFPPHERGTAFSLFGFNAGLASVAGPVVGGFLISANIGGLDWRPIFLVNLPVGIIAFIGALIYVPKIRPQHGLTLDWVGVPLAAIAVFAAIFPLIEGRQYEWPAWAFGMLVFSVLAFGVFYWWEKQRERQGKSELLPVRLMKNRNFSVGTLMLTVLFAGMPGFFMVFAIFLQNGFGFTPLQSGLTTLPLPLGIMVASFLNGWLKSNYLRPRVGVAMALVVIGEIILHWVVSGVGENIDHWWFVVPLVLMGLGLGMSIGSIFQIVLSDVPPRDAGSASGSVQSLQQLGAAFGIAFVGEIFFSTLGQSPNHQSFVSALSNAVLYQICVFLCVLLLLFFTRKPVPSPQAAATMPAAAVE